MAELFIELFSEEIPAKHQIDARQRIKQLIEEKLKKREINFKLSKSFSTPKRLVFLIDGIPEKIEQKKKNIKGPNVNAPQTALDGFIKSNNLTRQEIYKKKIEKGEFYFAETKSKVIDVLQELQSIIPEAFKSYSWKKSMKWSIYDLSWSRPLKSIIALFNNKIIAVSKSVVDFTINNQNIPQYKFVTIYNSIDIEQFKFSTRKNKLNNKNFTVGFLGRLHKQKDLPTLLEAAKIIDKKNKKIRFLIGGKGQEKEKLLKITNNLNLKHTVKFIDHVNDINSFFAKIDVFVLSSIVEGHPLALLEAMASGLPCVATNVGGIPETIINGESGFIVEKSNPLHLAIRILDIANSVLLQQNMGNRGRKIIEEKFDSKIITQKHHWLYKSLIN